MPDNLNIKDELLSFGDLFIEMFNIFQYFAWNKFMLFCVYGRRSKFEIKLLGKQDIQKF